MHVAYRPSSHATKAASYIMDLSLWNYILNEATVQIHRANLPCKFTDANIHLHCTTN